MTNTRRFLAPTLRLWARRARHLVRGPWPLWAHLSLLALCTSVPLLAFSGLLLRHFDSQDRAHYGERLLQTVNSVANDIDRQLQAMTVTLRTLATSRYVSEGRLADFHGQARRAIGNQFALLVRDPKGQVLLDTRKPAAAVADDPAGDVEDSPLTLGDARVSDLVRGSAGAQPMIEIDLPLSRNGVPRYEMAIVFSPDLVRDILLGQRIPQGWVTGVSDATMHVVARSEQHERFVGQPLPDELKRQRLRAGVFPARNLDGVEVLRTVARLKSADWMVAATVPQLAVMGAASSAVSNLLIIGALVLALSMLLAALLSRRIASHIAVLARIDTGPAASQSMLPASKGPVREVNAVAGLLARAAERRREHEARIEQQHGFLNLVLTAVPSVIYIYDLAEHRTKFFSGAMSTVLGYSPAETEAMPDPLAHLVMPEDIPALREHHRALAELPPGATRTIEYRMRHKSGAWHWLMSIDRPWRRDASGKLLEILGVAVDITGRKEMEADLALHASVTNAAHDALISIDRNGIIETWNPGAERLFGYSAAEAIGSHARLLSAPEQHDEQTAMLADVRAGRTVGPLDAVRRRRDGSEVEVSLSMSPVVAPDGSVIGVVKAAQDVSERKRLERRQALLAKELVHRGKNQLAVIASIVRATLRSTPDPKAFTDALFGRLQSLAAAQDILVAQQWECADLSEVARAQLLPHLDHDLSRIRLEGPRVVLPAEYAVPIGLALHELATNAAKYGALSTPHGYISLKWTASRTPAGTETLDLSWREMNGPPVATPVRRGFGSTLIDHCVPGSQVSRRYEPAGLVCTMHVPLAVSPIEGASPGDTSGLYAAHG
jgi:PAS domain S-box-containing protein